MTTRTITLSTDDLAALRAIRPVIADAHAHPGRAAAIAALDWSRTRASGTCSRARALAPSSNARPSSQMASSRSGSSAASRPR